MLKYLGPLLGSGLGAFAGNALGGGMIGMLLGAVGGGFVGNLVQGLFNSPSGPETSDQLNPNAPFGRVKTPTLEELMQRNRDDANKYRGNQRLTQDTEALDPARAEQLVQQYNQLNDQPSDYRVTPAPQKGTGMSIT